MPLPPSLANREKIHGRRIFCDGFRRDDGLLEIEGHIRDERPFPYHGHWDAKPVEGVPIHEMWLRLVIDGEKRIVDAAATLDHGPFPLCQQVGDHYRRLIGLTIGPGFSKQVFDRVGGVEGCTHITGLIQIMATTLLQAIVSEVQRIHPDHAPATTGLTQDQAGKVANVFDHPGGKTGFSLLDSCHSYAARGAVIQRLAPKFHQPEQDGRETK